MEYGETGGRDGDKIVERHKVETFRPILCIFPEMQLAYDPDPGDRT